MPRSKSMRVSRASRLRPPKRHRSTTNKTIRVARIQSLSQNKVVPNPRASNKNESTAQSTKVSYEGSFFHHQLQTMDESMQSDAHHQSIQTTSSRVNDVSPINTSFTLSIKSKLEHNGSGQNQNPSAASDITYINECDTMSEAHTSTTRQQKFGQKKNEDSTNILQSSTKKPDERIDQCKKNETTNPKKYRRRKGAYGFCFSPCCIALSIIGALLVFAAVAGLIVALLSQNRTTTKTSTARTTTSTSTSSTTVTTTSTSATTVTTTTTTTTTSFYCGASCLYQSWYDSSGGLAFWPFDGDYTDIVGSYSGYPSPKLPSFVTGVFGKAIYLNESAKQAIFTPYIPLRNRSFTVEAWIKPTGYPNPSDFSIVGLCPSQTTNYCLHINIRNTKLYFGFYFNDVQGGTTIQLNQWIHTAFVFEVSTRVMRIYLNGVVDGQTTLSSSLLVMSGNFTIGTNEGVVTPDNYFDGIIDQLSINRRAKSACEVLEIATLAAHFKFDLPTISIDSSPNNINTTSSSVSTIVSGSIYQALLFSGSSSSYFQGSGLTSLGFTNQRFSISLWIQPQTLAGTLVHLSSSSTGTGINCFPLIGFSSTGAIVAQVLTTSATIVTATGPILPISSTAWVPIVQTWSTTNGLRLYVNGTLVSSVAATTFAGSGTTPNYLTLGGCLSGCLACPSGQIGAPGPYLGGMDDVRVFLRELTAVDVCTLIATA